jgi:hypothetical protein
MEIRRMPSEARPVIDKSAAASPSSEQFPWTTRAHLLGAKRLPENEIGPDIANRRHEILLTWGRLVGGPPKSASKCSLAALEVGILYVHEKSTAASDTHPAFDNEAFDPMATSVLS